MYLSRVDLRFSFWEINAFVFIRLIFSNHLLQYSLRGHQFVFEDPVHFWKLTLNHKPERGNPLVRIIGCVSPIWESSMRAISSRYKLNTKGKGYILIVVPLSYSISSQFPYCQFVIAHFDLKYRSDEMMKFAHILFSSSLYKRPLCLHTESNAQENAFWKSTKQFPFPLLALTIHTCRLKFLTRICDQLFY